jgi:hypothetical protein
MFKQNRDIFARDTLRDHGNSRAIKGINTAGQALHPPPTAASAGY